MTSTTVKDLTFDNVLVKNVPVAVVTPDGEDWLSAEVTNKLASLLIRNTEKEQKIELEYQ